VGHEAISCSLEKGLTLPYAIAQTHLFLLSHYQDSLITRKLGPKWSREVQARAHNVWEQGGWLTPNGQEHVQEFDRWLREDGHHLNPGTTADLVAGILFVYLLEKDLTR
jgi:triphosphoribosyl-dephospho-CoA synthase